MSFMDIAQNIAFEERFEKDRYFIAMRKRWRDTTVHIIPTDGEDYIALCGQDMDNDTWVEDLLARETCAKCANMYYEQRVKTQIGYNRG